MDPAPRSGGRARPADIDDYDVDLEDIFREISPPPELDDNDSRQKKDREGLGLDHEVSVAKRARAPRVKLDEQRLLSADGISKLRTRAKALQFKGKAHEFSDAARLLSLYQLWLDDLFPKAQFLDALAMTEKAGHKTSVLAQRKEWITEERRAKAGLDDYNPTPTEREARELDEAMTETGAPARNDTIDDDDDIYTASPRRQAPRSEHIPAIGHPDDDDDEAMLEALIQEANETRGPLDGQRPGHRPSQEEDMFADEEAAMAEMEGM